MYSSVDSFRSSHETCVHEFLCQKQLGDLIVCVHTLSTVCKIYIMNVSGQRLLLLTPENKSHCCWTERKYPLVIEAGFNREF